MIIVEPSFELQDDLDNASLAVRLEACGRICYKSEDKISKDSAVPFVKRLASYGHNSVLEMAVVTLQVTCTDQDLLDFLAIQPKFLTIDRLDEGFLVTASVRAFRELYQQASDLKVVHAMVAVLAEREPYLYEGIFDPDTAGPVDADVQVKKIGLKDVEKLADDLLMRHRYVGVKFIVNRAVTHELVRHRVCSFLQESQRYCNYNKEKFDGQVTFIKPLFFEEDSEKYQLWKTAMEDAEKKYLKLLESASPQASRTVLPNSCKTEIIMYCNLQEWQHIISLRTSKGADPSMREIMIPFAEELKRRYPMM